MFIFHEHPKTVFTLDLSSTLLTIPSSTTAWIVSELMILELSSRKYFSILMHL